MKKWPSPWDRWVQIGYFPFLLVEAKKKKKKKKIFAFQYHGKQFKTGMYLKSENRSRAQPARILIILRLYVLIAIYNFIYH
jgi:hypothetical protein